MSYLLIGNLVLSVASAAGIGLGPGINDLASAAHNLSRTSQFT
jgi:hypothetical protein